MKVWILLLCVLIIGCASVDEVSMGLKLESSDFEDGERLQKKFGYKNENIQPQLTISNAPKGTQSFAIIMDDPDAMAPAGKVWVHWIIWNIKPETTQIQKGSQGTQGITDFNKIGYGGPAPPDKEHTYIFKLYALDATIDLQEGATKIELEDAMKGHIIEESSLRGTYIPD